MRLVHAMSAGKKEARIRDKGVGSNIGLRLNGFPQPLPSPSRLPSYTRGWNQSRCNQNHKL